jgi:hypothetical protein
LTGNSVFRIFNPTQRDLLSIFIPSNDPGIIDFLSKILPEKNEGRISMFVQGEYCFDRRFRRRKSIVNSFSRGLKKSR